jgi:hypothetical protein
LNAFVVFLGTLKNLGVFAFEDSVFELGNVGLGVKDRCAFPTFAAFDGTRL